MPGFNNNFKPAYSKHLMVAVMVAVAVVVVIAAAVLLVSAAVS